MTSSSKLKNILNTVVVCFIVINAWRVLAIDPAVSNVQAEQRAGTRLVDITYNVQDPDSPTLEVYLKVSSDGGQTWKGPVKMVSGDVGRHILPGSKKRIVWNAGEENPNQFGKNYRYKIGVSDQPVAPSGMVLIPAGSYNMGGIGDINGIKIGPIHNVEISSFAMDKWEVTAELWIIVKQWADANGYDLVNGESFGPKHPITSISWCDIVKWNNARSEMNQMIPAYYEDEAMKVVYRQGNKVPRGVKWRNGYRLPTEAEWEKAARGGVENKQYPWATDSIDSSLANYYESEKYGTVPVGSYAPNGYGLFDMAGNVMERCWDIYSDYSDKPQKDPLGPTLGENRVVRGGAWLFEPDYCRVTFRSNVSIFSSLYGRTGGFRSVLNPENP